MPALPCSRSGGWSWLDELSRPQLQAFSLSALETLFRESPCGDTPAGRYRGWTLTRLPTAGARVPWVRVAQYVGFELLPYGVDFDAGCWFFLHPRLRLGRFRAAVRKSRWRKTTAVALTYEPSRLPPPVPHTLYDEVKPLNRRLCLGIGGLNAERGHGDHFFFALERMDGHG